MLTGKQRSFLKGLSHSYKPLAQVGKEGISEAFLTQLSVLLDQHELVKINILDNSMESADSAARQICEALNAEFVQAMGNKLTIYRQSRNNPMLEIPGADNTRAKINRQNKEMMSKKATTKKGGVKSRPNQGKRSVAKAKREEAEKLEKEQAMAKFKYSYSKDYSNKSTRSLGTSKEGGFKAAQYKKAGRGTSK